MEAARIAALFALVLILAWLVARLFWLFISPGPAVSDLRPHPLPTPLQASGGSEVRADLSLIMTQNPFQAADTEAVVVTDAPETDLNLKLSALFMSTGEGVSSATIVTPDNETSRYELGDEILPGVILEQVLSDRAIISRDGREETIMRSGRTAGLSVIGDPAAVKTDAGQVTTESTPLFNPGISARTLMAGLAVEVEQEDGVTESLLLQPRGDATLMNSAGLAPGDRLVNVNGTRVAELDPSALASRLATGGTTTITIVREGEIRTVDIRFEEE